MEYRDLGRTGLKVSEKPSVHPYNLLSGFNR